jgi:hypothetical protein
MMKDAGKQNANENIWTQGKQTEIKVENCAVRTLMTCAADQTRSTKSIIFGLIWHYLT